MYFFFILIFLHSTHPPKMDFSCGWGKKLRIMGQNKIKCCFLDALCHGLTILRRPQSLLWTKIKTFTRRFLQHVQKRNLRWTVLNAYNNKTQHKATKKWSVLRLQTLKMICIDYKKKALRNRKSTEFFG